MNKNLFQRIAITILCLLGTTALTFIPLPFINFDRFQGLGTSSVSVGYLGIMPYIYSYIFLWIATMIIPSWKRRWQAENGENIFFHYALMLFVMIFSMLQAIQFSTSLIRSGMIESGFMSVIVSIILVAGVFMFIALAGIINRRGIGQGFSLIICMGFLRKIYYALIEGNNIKDVLRSVELTVVLLVVLIGFIIWITKIKWQVDSGNKKINLPFSIVGLFPSQVFGLSILIILFLQIINPEWVNVFIRFFNRLYILLPFYFILCLIVSFFYLRRIIKKVSKPTEIISSKSVWKWTIFWTFAYFLISQNYYLLLLIVKNKQFLNLSISSSQLYIFIFTIITFMQQWRHRNWKPVFSHSDPAMVYAKAAELQQEDKEVCVVPTEGLGAAYGFIVGNLAERYVMIKDEKTKIEK